MTTFTSSVLIFEQHGNIHISFSGHPCQGTFMHLRLPTNTIVRPFQSGTRLAMEPLKPQPRSKHPLIDVIIIAITFGAIQALYSFISIGTPLGWLLVAFQPLEPPFIAIVTLLITRNILPMPRIYALLVSPVSLYITGTLSTLPLVTRLHLEWLCRHLLSPFNLINDVYGHWGLSALLIWLGRLLFFKRGRPIQDSNIKQI